MGKFIGFCLFALFPVLCGAKEIGMGFIERVVEEGGDKVYLHVAEKLNDDAAVEYQYSENGEGRCCGRLGVKDLKLIGESRKLFRDDGARGLVYQVDQKSFEYRRVAGFVGIALVNAYRVKERSADKLEVWFNKNKFLFEQCYGSEGINLYRKHRGKVEGHIYFYLNYDIEPSCHGDSGATSEK